MMLSQHTDCLFFHDCFFLQRRLVVFWLKHQVMKNLGMAMRKQKSQALKKFKLKSWRLELWLKHQVKLDIATRKQKSQALKFSLLFWCLSFVGFQS